MTPTQVKCYQEVLVLLWKIMEENPAFTQYVLKHCDVNEVSPEMSHAGVS